jgi:hypothetical protein
MSTTSLPGPFLSGAWHDRSGFCGMDVLDRPSGTLRRGQDRRLRELAGRARVALDLFTVFAARYEAFPDELVHTRSRELTAIRLLLDRYGLPDPTAGPAVGVCTDAALQAAYDGLLAEGLRSRADVLRVTARLGAELVAMLGRDLPDMDAPDVRYTYQHLLVAAHEQVRLAHMGSGR